MKYKKEISKRPCYEHTVTVSQLIAELQEVLEKHGDLPVGTYSYHCEDGDFINTISVCDKADEPYFKGDSPFCDKLKEDALRVYLIGDWR